MLFWIVGAIEDAIMHAAARPTLSLLLRRAPNYTHFWTVLVATKTGEMYGTSNLGSWHGTQGTVTTVPVCMMFKPVFGSFFRFFESPLFDSIERERCKR